MTDKKEIDEGRKKAILAFLDKVREVKPELQIPLHEQLRKENEEFIKSAEKKTVWV